MNRRFAFLFCISLVCLCVIVLSPKAVAAGAYCGAEGDGSNLTWALLSDGTMTISGSGKMENWNSNSSLTSCPWGSSRAYIKKVIIEEGVTSIGNYAFYRCKNLKQVVIPDSVTTIGEWAFQGCLTLTQITVPDSVTSLGKCVFSGCEALEYLPLPKGITYIADNMFAGCDSFSQITIPNGITTIGNYAFTVCYSLIQITIPDSVTSVGMFAFNNCTELTEIIFKGNAPAIGRNAFKAVSATINATAYYPADNPTWTEDKLQDYGGDITWVPYTKGMVYHPRFSMDTIPQDEFNLKITVTRLRESADDISMIGLYSAEGQFLEMEAWELSADTVQTYTLSRDNTDGKVGQIRVFVLDSLANPVPLAKAAEITSDI